MSEKLSVKYLKKFDDWDFERLAKEIEKMEHQMEGCTKYISYAFGVMHDEYCSIKSSFTYLYCTDFLVQSGRDYMSATSVLAEFMVKNLPEEDKAAYIQDYKNFWDKRIETTHTNALEQEKVTLNHLTNLVKKAASNPER